LFVNLQKVTHSYLLVRKILSSLLFLCLPPPAGQQPTHRVLGGHTSEFPQ